jgi:uncharacterized metal-binding protein
MSETAKQDEMWGKFKSIVLFTCSGRSNAGKLTDIASKTLSFHRPYLFRAIPKSKGVESLKDAKKDGELIFVVDGCEEHCAKKKLEVAGIEADMQVVLTQIGIKKTNPSDINSEYVEQVMSALNNAVKSMQK